MSKLYQTPNEWYSDNKKELKKYRGEWIAFSKDGIIAHNRQYRQLRESIHLDPSAYIIDRIFENEFCEPIKFRTIRLKTVKYHEWQPKYDVSLKFNQSSPLQVKMLVDSGADFSLITKQLGIDLGYSQAPGEVTSKAEGIGGSINYLLRNIEITLDSHTLTVPVAWVQTDECEEIILGREVVFDQFNIEFRQADEEIIFTWRSDN